MVPILSILFMAVSAIVSVGFPVALYLYWRKKYGLKIIPCIVGAIAFILFALVLEQMMHMAVLRPGADGYIALKENNPALYVLYGIFAAGIFEETARFVSFYILKKKYSGIGTSLSYGIGHGGVESVLLSGLAMISSIVMAVLINVGAAGVLGETPVIETQIEALISTNPVMFLASGIERVSAVTVHIALSVLVWHSVNRKGKLWLYPAAVLGHAFVDLFAVLFQIGTITSIALIEVLVAVCALLLAAFAYLITRKYAEENVL